MTPAEALTRLRDANPVADPTSEVVPDVMHHTKQMIMNRGIDADARRPASRSIRRWGTISVAVSVAALLGLTLQWGADAPRGLPGAATALADAIQQSGAVLHTIDDGPQVPNAAGGPGIAREETWATLDGAVRRTLTTYSDGSLQDLRYERRDDQYQVTVYRSRTREVHVAPWLKSPSAPTQQFAPLSAETVRDYAAIVKSGRARLDGRADIDGRTALRIVDTTDGPAGGTTWFISEAKPPVLLQVQRSCRDDDRSCGAPTTYLGYEVSDDRAALEIPDYAGADVIRDELP